MSRIGRAIMVIPDKVKADLKDSEIKVSGPKGNLSFQIPEEISVEIKEGRIRVSRASDLKRVCALHGLVRAQIYNMLMGVSQGFEKILELTGVGYRVQKQGRKLVFAMGYSHPVEIDPPAGIEFEVDKQNKVFVRGIDRRQVGQVSAEIRAIREVEPYKGKGIKYSGEQVRRKAGKAAKTVAAAAA